MENLRDLLHRIFAYWVTVLTSQTSALSDDERSPTWKLQNIFDQLGKKNKFNVNDGLSCER